MRVYLHTGPNRAKAVTRLALSSAGLHQPTYVASFSLPEEEGNFLALRSGTLPIDAVRVRLPGLGLPRGHAPRDDMAIQAVMAVLNQVIASGEYRLVILDGIRAAVAEGLLAGDLLQPLVAGAAEDTQVAMT
jgi:ATP:corrinoid adenosyltransferase